MALRDLNRNEAARGSLLEARTIAEALGTRRTHWRILVTLSQLESDHVKALSYRRKAHRVIDFIAKHITQDDLRESLLNLAVVTSVIEDI